MAELHRYGGFVAPERLNTLVAAFRNTGLLAWLILPRDHAATAEDHRLEATSTTAGTMWSADAECSWRIEDEQAVITVLADKRLALAGFELERVDCEVEDLDPVRWRPGRPFSDGTADIDAIHPRLYLVGGVPAHRRLVVRELPHG